ncbi:TolB family protein [Actinokineospora sp.]|uniref:TolB family protein n=1 Tax=Actinokineospora sp. TaxID=1872133 RepID=UPI003D6C585C
MAVVYVASASRSSATGALDLAARNSVVFVDGSGKVGQLSRTDSSAVITDRSCLRVYSAAGTTVCLRSVTVPPGFEAEVLGPDLSVTRVIKLDGTPSRARVSDSGNLVGWTVFREGDSYMAPGYFSTTAGIFDRKSGTLYGSMEDFTSSVDGVEHHAIDRNFWGVTFADDDRTFYVTLGSGGKTYLMRGNLVERTLKSVIENAECPSLSPDGTRVAYKKRFGDQWRLHVLDLGSLKETALAEAAHVDDQAAWLDGSTIAYSRPVGGVPGIFTVPADGGGEVKLLRAGASSPSAVGS